MDLTWLLPALGVLGGGGFVLALLFAPAAAAVIGREFGRVLDTRAGLAALALAIGLFLGARYRERIDADGLQVAIAARDTQWRKTIGDAAKAFEDAKGTLSARVKAQIDAANAKHDAAMQAAENKWQQKFTAYEKTVKDDPACKVRPEDLQ